MIDTSEIIRQMTANAEAMRTLVQTVSSGQAQWKPTPETWCLKEVMEHIYNEERIDFRKHLKEIFSKPPQPWAEFNPEEYLPVNNLRQALEGFLTEREASITWIKAQPSPNWEAASPTSFSPDGEVLVLKAGDLLVSWVAHDYLHLRQLNELLYAWNEKQASRYSVRYAGGW